MRELGSLSGADLRAIARAPEAPLELLMLLLNHPDRMLRESAAENPSLPLETLYELITHSSKAVRIALARRRSLPFDIGQKLLKDEEVRVRRALALNTSTVPELLARLALDEFPDVRAAVALARQVTLTILYTLVSDSHPAVRNAAASSHIVTPHLLRRLAHDESWYVREAVLSRSTTPTDAVVVMAKSAELRERPCMAEVIGSLLEERFGTGREVPTREELRMMLQSPSVRVKELAQRLAIELWKARGADSSPPKDADSAQAVCPGAA